jgi:hypothetical protein
LKKLIIDIKDGYAAIAAGGDFDPRFFKIEFEEQDFIGEMGETRALNSLGLFKLGDEAANKLYTDAEQLALVLPMRFSLIKPISIDLPAIEILGDEFLSWEARQQLPEELGTFETGFYKLRKSFDNKTFKYMFYAASSDFVEVLARFIGADDTRKPTVESEAYGLYKAINLASNGHGVGAAISLEHDGAAVVVAHDGDFVGAKFIYGDSPALGEEIMYYVIASAPDDTQPNILICGDSDHLDHLGSINWANRLDPSQTPGLTAGTNQIDQSIYIVAAGLNITSED